jgi:ASC-1-like (ASCH) protein
MDHVAELNREPLEKIIKGERTIEPIFSRELKPPFKAIDVDDTVYFKIKDGFAIAKAKVTKVENYEDLTPEKAQEIIEEHKEEIRPTNIIFERDIYYKYATLIWLDNLYEIKPFRVKRNSANPSNWCVTDDINKVREK